MDWGLALVCKILETKDLKQAIKQGITPEMLPGPPGKYLTHLLAYAKANGGAVPSAGNLQRNFPEFVSLPPVQEDWTEVFHEIALQRRRVILTEGLQQSATALRDNNLDGAEQSARALASRLAQTRSATQVTDIAQSALSFRDAYLARKAQGALTGIPTGIPWFDEVTFGWQPTDMIVLAGERASLKTWHMLLFALRAWVHGYFPLIVTMEMGVMNLMRRVYALHARVPYTDLLAGTLNEYAEDEFFKTLELFSTGLPFVVATPRGEARPSISWVRALIEEHDPDLVAIDGVYRMHDDQGGQNHLRYTHLSQDTKTLANQTGKPIFVTTQMVNLSRATSGGGRKKREGGDADDVAFSNAFTQDADIVLSCPASDKMKEANEVRLAFLKLREGRMPKPRHFHADFSTMTFGEPKDVEEDETLDNLRARQEKEVLF